MLLLEGKINQTKNSASDCTFVGCETGNILNLLSNTTAIGYRAQAGENNTIVLGRDVEQILTSYSGGTICNLGSDSTRFLNLYLDGDISAVNTLRFQDGSEQTTAYTGGGSDLSGITQTGAPASNGNTALGVNADPNTIGTGNVAIGFQALHDPSGTIPAFSNVVVGANAFSNPNGFTVTDAVNNVVIGNQAAIDVSGGVTNNVIIGYNAQAQPGTIFRNVVIGADAGTSPGVENSTCIGYQTSADISNIVVLGNSDITNIISNSITCDLGSEFNRFNNLYLFGDISAVNTLTFQDGTQQTTAATGGGGGGSDLSGITQERIGFTEANTTLGVNAFPEANTGFANVAIGYGAMKDPSGNLNPNQNVVIGAGAFSNLQGHTADSSNNIIIGYEAVKDPSGTISQNIIIGIRAQDIAENIRNNVIIGTGVSGNGLAQFGVAPDVENSIVIGFNATATVSNEMVFGNGAVTTLRNSGNGTCDLGSIENPFRSLHLSCNDPSSGGVIYDVSKIQFCDGSEQTTAYTGGAGGGSDLSGITEVGPSGNTALGFGALGNGSDGTGNVAIGFESMYISALGPSHVGDNDIAIGFESMFAHPGGKGNIAVGVQAFGNGGQALGPDIIGT